MESPPTPDQNPPPEPQRVPASQPPAQVGQAESGTRLTLNREKLLRAFWTVASVISLTVNIILIVALILVARELFAVKHLASEQLVGGLYNNFVKMDQAHIHSTVTVSDTIQVKDTIQVNDTIQVKDTIPVVFDLPLNQETQVILTRNTPVKDATIFLNGKAVPLDLILKKGTALNIQLNLTVPVNQQLPVTLNVPVNLKVPVQLKVPVSLKVPVDIPLNQTELHDPFVGLQEVVAPYSKLLSAPPNSWSETPLCGTLTGWLCQLVAGK